MQWDEYFHPCLSLKFEAIFWIPGSLQTEIRVEMNTGKNFLDESITLRKINDQLSLVDAKRSLRANGSSGSAKTDIRANTNANTFRHKTRATGQTQDHDWIAV